MSVLSVDTQQKLTFLLAGLRSAAAGDAGHSVLEQAGEPLPTPAVSQNPAPMP